MANNIEQLAREFEQKLEPKQASRRGVQMNAKKILKSLEKTRDTYKDSRNKLRRLESEMEKLENEIQECRDGVRHSRAEMLKMNQVLQNMDLADAQYAVFYDNELDVGYIIGNDEHYLDLDEAGEIKLTPMKEHKRRLKNERNTDDESYIDDVPPGIELDAVGPLPSEPEQEVMEDSGAADDGASFIFPNFRFID